MGLTAAVKRMHMACPAEVTELKHPAGLAKKRDRTDMHVGFEVSLYTIYRP